MTRSSSATSAAIEQLAATLGRAVRGSSPVHGGCITETRRLDLDDGGTVFAKFDGSAPSGFFESEATGLGWLRAAGALRVPDVLAVGEHFLALEWVEPGRRHAHTDDELGRGLAQLHLAGAMQFGRPPSAPAHAYLATLPVADGPAATWGEFWIEGRVRPLAAIAVDRGELPPAALRSIDALADRIDEVAGPPEAPARVHGDLWAGNVHVDVSGNPWLVDPSAHGGHRETDLAMLALFGGVDVGRVIQAYEEVTPLADGWRDRVSLHQLAPLLAHVALFGRGYIDATRHALEVYVTTRW